MSMGNLSDSQLVAKAIVPTEFTTGLVVTGTGVDCQSHETMLAIVTFGVVPSGTLTVKFQESSDDAGSDPYADIALATTAAIATGDASEVYLFDFNLSERERFIRAVATDAGGANTNVVGCDFVFAKSRHLPPTQENTVTQIGYT